jgi:CheY-like chemotaxis protein
MGVKVKQLAIVKIETHPAHAEDCDVGTTFAPQAISACSCTDGLAVLDQIRKDRGQRLPVIVYAIKELSTADATRLKNVAASAVVRGPRSVARLLDDSAQSLHIDIDQILSVFRVWLR